MAVSAYEVISTQTLVSAAATVTFSSIPQTYTDLVLVFNGQVATANNIVLQFNSDTTTNYSATYIYGDGTSAVSGRIANRNFIDGGGVSAASNSTSVFNIFNYTNVTTFKTVTCRSSTPGDAVYAWVSVWRKTPESINSILVKTVNSYNFSVGCTFALYGIKAST